MQTNTNSPTYLVFAILKINGSKKVQRITLNKTKKKSLKLAPESKDIHQCITTYLVVPILRTNRSKKLHGIKLL